jgi:hypothetical protein
MPTNEIPASSLEALKAIAKSKLKTFPMPVATYLQEAEDLYLWSLGDQQRLAAAGLPEGTIESLPPRADLCRKLQARWSVAKKMRPQSKKPYKEKLALGIERRKSVVSSFRYAFRNRPDLLAKLKRVSQNNPRPALFQSLHNLAALGKNQIALLSAIGFNPEELDELRLLSNELRELYAARHFDQGAVKDLRNRSFFYLKEAVDEIRNCGKYVFLKEPDRLNGYFSQYLKQKSSAQKIKREQERKNNHQDRPNGTQE